MNAIVTVVGKDKVGIIAGVSSVMAELNINILDISQTIMDNYFTMIMMVDFSNASNDISEIRKKLDQAGKNFSVSINLQHKDVYEAMHRI
ncbi:MAG: ACT domain-containing protein [Chlamydiae bacterium]|nr:MAG: ACT domain-containing protein [Chlamydiota bacterium]